ncbi:uncharacterized protein PpBr36_10098 [Pyricularia pennisetigena]|uniref:uncharacterized protein n=1 Tax=Pyricularia pennisetigena TaxID=1578925 RepID=UPI0011520467|nr:uncharacterized protein PpBr36_10098 [Pyricularia pennisetigena]TLS22146.1 hypothetical protein PpBr36_10098 [Pyricularia pennisetigena]
MASYDSELHSIPEPEKINTPWSCAIPPASRHSITSHFQGWQALLVKLIITISGLDPTLHTCFVFPRLQVAQACQTYITRPDRPDGLEALEPSTTSIRAFESTGTGLHMFAVTFPVDKLVHVMAWWSDTGMAVSSRFAEAVLADTKGLHEVALDAPPAHPSEVGPAHEVVRKRIARLMERAPITSRERTVQPSDVYLFQSGMAAIYNLHQWLHGLRGGKSAIFGALFYETKHVVDKYGGGLEFFPGGVELDDLERFLEAERAEGRAVVSVWTEIPSNPLLVTPDLTRLRRLADEHGFVLVVDDTVGGVCNVDVLPVADVVITSLTKLFSGHADVMAGSAVLNPSSTKYSALKAEFERRYVNDLFAEDAKALRHNSEDYLHRAAVANRNAMVLTDWLHKRAKLGGSSIKHVLYPTTTPTGTQGNFEVLKRPATADFTPGHGCLFTIEFHSQDAAVSFYDNLHVYQGPHLGAHRTIALPYAYLIYGPGDQEKLRRMGMTTAQIRISVGYEDERTLLDTFKYAVLKADAAERAKWAV